MIIPMDCKQAEEIPIESDLIYERKYDGVRAIIIISKEHVEIHHSESPNVMNYRYPQLTKELAKQKPGIYDGEICVFENGFSNIKYIQHRQCSNRRKVQMMAKKYPVTFMAFDMLSVNGESIAFDKLLDRKKMLEQQLRPSNMIHLVNYYKTPDEILKDQDYIEGVVIKDINSVYEEGKRTGSWRKKRFVQEATVKVVELEEYNRDGHRAGVVCITDDGGRINLPGPRAEKALELIGNNGSFRAEISFFEKTEKGYRFPVVKRILGAEDEV